MTDPRPDGAPAPCREADDPTTRASAVVVRATAAALDVSEVYARNVRVVWRFLASLGVRDADLEDLCQEVFLVVHRRLAEFDRRHPLTTWLYAICLRIASAHRRKAHVRYERAVEEPPDTVVDPSQADDVARAEAHDLLRRALDTLDDDKRAVLVLFELELQPMTEVAAAVGVPLQTAYSRLYAARRELARFASDFAASGGAP